ncbi:MAG: DUF3488 and transglutaminase-like domain-containing protein [Acidobacteriota bacterium]|nr:DUF3488 and transglutaminase-like domain-containing protein [Acidobacteriota bacterium]
MAKRASSPMSFDKFFKIISYAVVICGFLSLWVSGGFGIIVTSLFLGIIISAWFLEESRWQISERVGTALIVLVVPLFYIGWKYKIIGAGATETIIAGLLARMILILAAVKLLQKKSDRDWIFLYLISFFEVLLAAGLSISPLYLVSFILYLLVTICAIVSFEIGKTSRIVNEKNCTDKKTSFTETRISRLPLTAISLLILIIALATPLFFVLPRVGGAGFGNNSNGLSGMTGFSDSVRLGSIGRLKQNDETVMRVRLDKTGASNFGNMYWRGVALDKFDNKVWSNSKFAYKEVKDKGEKDFFLIDYSSSKQDVTVQTVYREPIDTPVLFALSRPVAVQGNFQILFKDSEGAMTFNRSGFDRLSYKVYSDRSLPSQEKLKADNSAYSEEDRHYLQLPETMDVRISQLAAHLTEKSNNRFDKAKTVENYLQTQFGYTLEMKASGGEPLADFLFNIREGHCEYFATAMAIMLRTQGIATRVVNGFQQGEYNETADVFVVKQKDAHSWVEVYFPRENAWIPFDPTPFAGKSNETGSAGIVGSFNKYLEALETFWIQYFVAFDNQEQRSLFRYVKSSFSDYQSKTSAWLTKMQYRLSDWWTEVRGDKGLQASAKAIAFGIGYLIAAVLGIILIIWLYRKIIKLEIWQRIYAWLKYKNETTVVEFYEQMQKVLAGKGFKREPHQTPLEFAFALQMPEAVKITERYNRVRFGEKNLSKGEAKEIENWLKNLEEIN